MLRDTYSVAETVLVLRRLYDVRSAVVHRGVRLEDIAGKKGFSWLQPDTFLDTSEDHVRSILRAFVRDCAQGADVHGVVERLEETIVSGLDASDYSPVD